MHTNTETAGLAEVGVYRSEASSSAGTVPPEVEPTGLLGDISVDVPHELRQLLSSVDDQQQVGVVGQDLEVDGRLRSAWPPERSLPR